MGMLKPKYEKCNVTFYVNGKHRSTYEGFLRLLRNTPLINTFFISDPVIHGQFELPREIAYLYSDKEFGRLSRIYQLGEKHLGIREAVHTRADHSMGCSITTGIVLRNSKNQQKISLSESDIADYMTAGLLHDSGHFPIGHINYEKLNDIGIECNEKKNTVDKVRKMECILKKYGFDFNKIVSILKGNDPLSYMYDYPVDIDKFDYKVRDGMICHVNSLPTPLSICNSLLNNLLATEEGWLIQQPLPRESIKKTVRSSITDLNRLRHDLYERIYWNDSRGRSADVMIKYLIGKYVDVLRKEGINSFDIVQLFLGLDDVQFYKNLMKKLPENRVLKRLIDAHKYPEETENILWKPVCKKYGDEAEKIVKENGLKSIEMEDKDGNIVAIDVRPLKKPKRFKILVEYREAGETPITDETFVFHEPQNALVIYSQEPYLRGESALRKALKLFEKQTN